MSQSQPWSLSQKTDKQSGVSSVCIATHQIHLMDGTLLLHGPRHKPCPGSNLPAIGNGPSSQSSTTQPNLQPSSAGGQSTGQRNAADAVPQFASISTLPYTADTSNANGSAQPSISHPAYTGPIIKHIPSSARQHISTELTSVLDHICSKPNDVSNWSTLRTRKLAFLLSLTSLTRLSIHPDDVTLFHPFHQNKPNSSCSHIIDRTLLELILMNISRKQSCMDSCELEKVNKCYLKQM